MTETDLFIVQAIFNRLRGIRKSVSPLAFEDGAIVLNFKTIEIKS